MNKYIEDHEMASIHPNTKVVTCSQCNRTYICDCANRIHGRPFCDECIAVHTPMGGARSRRGMHEYEQGEDSPWHENAVRALEDQ